MSSIKQLRLRIINGVNPNDGLVYSDSFDLMNIIDLEYLKKMCKGYMIEGFAIETSTFEKGTHTDKDAQNEFIPFLEYIHADEEKNNFSFKGESFAKMSYHIIRDSILDVSSDISLVFTTITPGDIEGSLEEISEIFGNSNSSKKQKVAHLAKKTNFLKKY